MFVVVGVLACYFDTSPEAMNYIVPTGRRAWKMLNHNFMLVKTLLHARIVFAPYDFLLPGVYGFLPVPIMEDCFGKEDTLTMKLLLYSSTINTG